MARHTLFIVAALMSQGVSAQYRCSQTDGKVSFQQSPCASSSQQQKLQLRDTAASAPLASEPERPAAAVRAAAPGAAASGTVE